jgi:hypothetical protein
MISEAPIKAAADLVSFPEQIRAFIAVAKVKAGDGLTVAEMSELLTSALRVAMAAVDSLPSTGPEKKALALAAVGAVFDALAMSLAVPLVLYPVWSIARPMVRAAVLSAASGAIESILPLIRGAK